jgi:hypothetical protein
VGIGCVGTERGTTAKGAFNDPIRVSGAVNESEAIEKFPPETSVNTCQKTRRHISETSNLHGHHCDSLRYNSIITTIVSTFPF